jgi:integrase/recombinase XerD
VPRDTSATINLRLSPLRKLAREMADNQMLDPAMAAAIARVPGVG